VESCPFGNSGDDGIARSFFRIPTIWNSNELRERKRKEREGKGKVKIDRLKEGFSHGSVHFVYDQPGPAKVEPADEDPDLVDEFKAEFRERWLNALDLAEVSTPDPLSFNGSKPPKTVYMRLSSGERLGEDSRICEAHFHPQEVLSHPNPRLIPGAIPSQLLKFPEPGPEFEAKAFGDFKLGFFKGMKETAEIIGKDLDLSQTIDEYNAEVLRNPASQQSRFVAIPLPTKPNQEGTWLGNKKKSNKQCFWMLENETVCGKTFAKNDSLRRHIEAEHKGIKPHACSLCDKSYSRKDYLDRHIKATHHSGSVEQPENEEGILSSFLPGPTNPKRMKMTQKCEIDDRTEELSDINQLVEVKLEAEDEDEDSESFSETRGNNIKAELQDQFEDVEMLNHYMPRVTNKKCFWLLENKSICGKTFDKDEALHRHIEEQHKVLPRLPDLPFQPPELPIQLPSEPLPPSSIPAKSAADELMAALKSIGD